MADFDLSTARPELFEALVGESYEVATEEQGEPQVQLRLAEVTRYARIDPATGRPFSLYFEGPADPPLPSGIAWFHHRSQGRLAIFVTPVVRSQDGLRYEAVFN